MTYTNFGYCALTAIGIGVQGYMDAMHTVKLREELGIAYPDDGIKSQKLGDTEWHKFSCYKTVHHHAMEYMPFAMTTLFIGGVHYPVISASFGAVYVIGRQVFATGYRTYGPEGRYNGNLILRIGVLGLLVTSITSSLKMLDLVNWDGY